MASHNLNHNRSPTRAVRTPEPSDSRTPSPAPSADTTASSVDFGPPMIEAPNVLNFVQPSSPPPAHTVQPSTSSLNIDGLRITSSNTSALTDTSSSSNSSGAMSVAFIPFNHARTPASTKHADRTGKRHGLLGSLLTPPDSSSRPGSIEKAKVESVAANPAEKRARAVEVEVREDDGSEHDLSAWGEQYGEKKVLRFADSFGGGGLGEEDRSAGDATKLKLLPSFLPPRQLSQAPAASGGSPDPFHNPNSTSNVYINGLPPLFSHEELARLASQFGKVLSCRVFHRYRHLHPATGVTTEGSTYAFVLYESIDDARRCITALRKYADIHPSFARTQKLPTARAAQPTTAAGLLDKSRPAYNGTPEASPPRASGTRAEEEVNVLIHGLPSCAEREVVEFLVSPHKPLSIALLPIGTEATEDARKIAYVRFASRKAADDTINKLDQAEVEGWPGALEYVTLKVVEIEPVGPNKLQRTLSVPPAPTSESTMPSRPIPIWSPANAAQAQKFREALASRGMPPAVPITAPASVLRYQQPQPRAFQRQRPAIPYSSNNFGLAQLLASGTPFMPNSRSTTMRVGSSDIPVKYGGEGNFQAAARRVQLGGRKPSGASKRD